MEPSQVIPTVPPVVPSVEQKSTSSSNRLKMLLYIFSFLLLLIGGGTIYNHYNPCEIWPCLIDHGPVRVPSNIQIGFSPTPAENTEWKTYIGETGYTTDGSSKFSIEYPSDWFLENNTLYPIGKNEDRGIETRLILGALGNGSINFTDTRHFPAGEAGYYWNKSSYGQSDYVNAGASFVKDNNAYIFILENLPTEYEPEYEDLFDQILASFRFVEETTAPSKNPIKGSIQIYHIDADSDSTIVSLEATSSMGTITEMKVWTDTQQNTNWMPYSKMHTVPFTGRNIVYAQFRDDKGNISEVYSDTTYPQQGPPEQ